MKKTLFYLLTGIIIVLSGACNEDEALQKSSDCQLLEFSINTKKAGIDEEGKTVTLELPYGSELTSLKPTIKVSDKAKVSPAAGVAQDFSQPVNYIVTAEDGSTATYSVSISVEKNDEAQITSFTFSSLTPAAVGIVNEAAKTISVKVPRGTAVSALTPTIIYSVDAEISPQSGVARDFSQPITYKVTSAKGREVVYTVQVAVEVFTGKQITSFVFSALTPAVTAAIDEAAKTITATTPYGTNVAALSPDIVLSAGASVAPESGTAQNFTNAVSYTVTAEDGGTSVYHVSVTMAPFDTQITGVSKTTVETGGTLTITGNFAVSSNEVTLTDGVTVITPTIEQQSTTSITVRIPANAQLGANYTLRVLSNGTGYDYVGKITITVPDIQINSVTPLSLLAGESINITGSNFKTLGNVVTLIGSSSYTLTVTSENATGITATTPNNIAYGSYTLKVEHSGKSAQYSTKIQVVDPTAPILTSLTKTTLVRGLDDLVVSGERLGVYGYIYLQKKGVNSYTYAGRTVTNGTLTWLAAGLIDMELGEYEVWWEESSSSKKSNKLTFSLLANPNPVPVITGISNANPCIGTSVVVSGSNFSSDAEVILNFTGTSGMIQKPDIESQTDTQIIFKTDNLYDDSTYASISVISLGQKATYTVAFQVQSCTP